MKNNGKEYEIFVAKLQQALLSSEPFSTQKNIKVEVNKIIRDNCGIDRQFDIYWEYELGGLFYKTIIECKDYNSSISIEKIDALIGKTRDIPNLKAVFATKTGYQSGAKIKAEQNKIELLIVREQNESDWSNEEVTKVSLDLIGLIPPRIDKFVPTVDKKWLEENNIDIANIPDALNTETFIEDIEKNEKYSLYELANKLTSPNGENYGVFIKKEKFCNAFLCVKDVNLKLNSYEAKYIIFKPMISKLEVDITKEVIGVIEYLQRGMKRKVFKNGVSRT